MPWQSKDAKKFTKKADSPKKEREWQHVANKVLNESHSEGKAIREANAVIRKQKPKLNLRKGYISHGSAV